MAIERELKGFKILIVAGREDDPSARATVKVEISQDQFLLIEPVLLAELFLAPAIIALREQVKTTWGAPAA